MEKFVKPEMEIVEFDAEDVIVTSGGLCLSGDTIPINPDPVTPCSTKDCSVYGIQW